MPATQLANMPVILSVPPWTIAAESRSMAKQQCEGGHTVAKEASVAAVRRPNIAIKLGGLGMAVAGYDWKRRETPPGSSEIANVYRPYVLHAVDVFSPARCMFESNFPVDGIAHGYGTLWNAFKRVTEHMSAAEQDALFHSTAARVYRIDG
jgi:L-fuconolactonase